MNKISSIRVQGFRSLADVELQDLGNVTVLIGPNGAGKSNLIRLFDLLSWMLKSRQLEVFVTRQGGADDQLFRGRQQTPQIHVAISIDTDRGRNDYEFSLVWGHPDRLLFTQERFRFSSADLPTEAPWQELGSGHTESLLIRAAQRDIPEVSYTTAGVILYLLRDCSTFQFHDTSDNSPLKRWCPDYDTAYLKSHGGNLAALLLQLEQEDIQRFDLINRQIQRILPTFDRFEILQKNGNALLAWRAKGSEKLIGAHLTSDGSLRCFALVTLLNLPPEKLPSVLLLDEPELGLHPAAIELVAQMILRVSQDRQVMIATQSPELVDMFTIDQVAVMDLVDGATRVKQLQADEYQVWLNEEYSPSALWGMNIVGGRP